MYTMLKPHTTLPWTSDLMVEIDLKEEIFAIGNHSIISAEVPWDNRDSNCTKEAAEQDAEYIVEACNKYPLLVEMLTTVEATCTDNMVAEKIRKFMTQNKLW